MKLRVLGTGLFFVCFLLRGLGQGGGPRVAAGVKPGGTAGVESGVAAGVESGAVAGVAHKFELGDSAFLLDGKPFVLISGEMHYPRIPREAWRARMKMARAMGLNTIGTYVFWNVHEPEKGVFDFSGNNDIKAFVQMAQEEGLWVTLRPSPYVCAEWEFGGYPYWLQNEKGLVVRSTEKGYLHEYEQYIHEVGRQLSPLLVEHGGNILMVQIENEYGSYGSDREYLEINKKFFTEAGFDGLLYTCDPAVDIEKGHLPGLLAAINGVDDPELVKRKIRENHDGKGPFYIAEWYPAWFDWWGAPHHTIPAAQYAGRLDTVLGAGISINMYMFHGGTTRGFMNGSNYKGNTPFEPQISSYDYDAPLDEAGNATPKFMAFRRAIEKHLPAGVRLPEVPKAKPSMGLPVIRLGEVSGLFQELPAAVRGDGPMTFEALHQDYGFVLYRSRLTGGRRGVLKVGAVRDYALVYIDGKRVGMIDRRLGQDSLVVDLPAGEVRLDILVENMGRIDFGQYLLQNKKGILGDVSFDGVVVKGWEHFGFPMKGVGMAGGVGLSGAVARGGVGLSGVVARGGVRRVGAAVAGDQPVLRRGSWRLSQVADTYLDMRKWGKGVVWVNGHNLGRYWSIGPQQTIYLPAEWLKKGDNEVVVLELEKTGQEELGGLGKPILDVLQ